MLLIREIMYCKPGKDYHDLVEYGRREVYKTEG